MSNKSTTKLDAPPNTKPEKPGATPTTEFSRLSAGPRVNAAPREDGVSSLGEMILQSEMQLKGDVEIHANTRISTNGGNPDARSKQVEVSSKDEFRDLVSALHRAGMPAQVVGRSSEGAATLRIPVNEPPTLTPAHLTVKGDLTIERDVVCRLPVHVRGNLRLEPDAVLVGDAVVGGSAILDARSVVAGRLDVRGDAFLGTNALVGSLHTRGDFDLDEGAAVLGELDVESAPRQAPGEAGEVADEETVEHVTVPEG